MAPRQSSGKKPSAGKPKPKSSSVPTQVPSVSLTQNQPPTTAQQQQQPAQQQQQPAQQQQQEAVVQAHKSQGSQAPTAQLLLSDSSGMDIDPPQQPSTKTAKGVGLGGFGDIEESLELGLPESWLQRAPRSPQQDLTGPLMAMLEESRKRKPRSPSFSTEQSSQRKAKKVKTIPGLESSDSDEDTRPGATTKAHDDADGPEDNLIKELKAKSSKFQAQLNDLKSTVDATVAKDWVAIKPYMDERLVEEMLILRSQRNQLASENLDLKAKLAQKPDDAKGSKEFDALKDENATLKAQILSLTDVQQKNDVLTGTIQSLQDALDQIKNNKKQAQAIEEWHTRLAFQKMELVAALDSTVDAENSLKKLEQCFGLDTAEHQYAHPHSAVVSPSFERRFIEKESPEDEMTDGEDLSAVSSLSADSSAGPKQVGLKKPTQKSNMLSAEEARRSKPASTLPSDGYRLLPRAKASRVSSGLQKDEAAEGQFNPANNTFRALEVIKATPWTTTVIPTVEEAANPLSTAIPVVERATPSVETRTLPGRIIVPNYVTDPSTSLFALPANQLLNRERAQPKPGSPEAIAIAESEIRDKARYWAVRNQGMALRAARAKEAAIAREAAAEKEAATAKAADP